MQSKWSDAEAMEFAARYAPKGVNADLAVRTYTTRLLGSDPKMVLHGGGNTSVKTKMRDHAEGKQGNYTNPRKKHSHAQNINAPCLICRKLSINNVNYRVRRNSTM